MNRRTFFRGLAMAPAVPLVALVEEAEYWRGDPDQGGRGWMKNEEHIMELTAERDWLAAAYERAVQLVYEGGGFSYEHAVGRNETLKGDGRWDPEKRRLRS